METSYNNDYSLGDMLDGANIKPKYVVLWIILPSFMSARGSKASVQTYVIPVASADHEYSCLTGGQINRCAPEQDIFESRPSLTTAFATLHRLVVAVLVE